MRILATVLLCSLCAAQELRRPTADMDAGSLTALGCFGTNQISAAMPQSYDSAGQASASLEFEAGHPTGGGSLFKTRLFKTWAAASMAYTGLTLNVNANTAGNAGDYPANGILSYSINGGSTWTQIFNDGGSTIPRQTYSIPLNAAQDLSQLRVGVCAQATSAKTGSLQPGSDTILVWDVWTVGQGSGQGAGNGSGAGARHNAVVVN